VLSRVAVLAPELSRRLPAAIRNPDDPTRFGDGDQAWFAFCGGAQERQLAPARRQAEALHG
jgi:hypothetical protein